MKNIIMGNMELLAKARSGEVVVDELITSLDESTQVLLFSERSLVDLANMSGLTDAQIEEIMRIIDKPKIDKVGFKGIK